MADEPKPVAQRSYEMGNVGAGARVTLAKRARP